MTAEETVRQSEKEHWKHVPIDAMSSEGEESEEGVVYHHAPKWRSDGICISFAIA